MKYEHANSSPSLGVKFEITMQKKKKKVRELNRKANGDEMKRGRQESVWQV